MKKNILGFFLIGISILIFSLFSAGYVHAGTPTLELQARLSDGLSPFGFERRSGDINGDGYKDFVTTNGRYSTYTGRLYVYFGKATTDTTPDTTPDLTITGEAEYDFFGEGADFSGGVDVADVNKDGYDDILVEGYGHDNYKGKVYLFYGGPNFKGDISASAANLTVVGNSTDKMYFGVIVRFVNANADSYPDIAILAPSNTPATGSKVIIYYNRNGTFDFNTDDVVVTTTGTNLLGFGGMLLDDYDGNGSVDILGAESYYNGLGISLYFGPLTNSSLKKSLFTPENPPPTDSFVRLGGLSSGDINKDGKVDFCAGAYTYSNLAANQGRVYCWYGSSLFSATEPAANADIKLDGFAAGDDFGRSTYLADVNNDGNLDLLVGAYQIHNGANGKFFIYKGNGTGFDTTPWISEVKTSGNTSFGNIVYAFDWDNDGWLNISVLQGGSASSGSGLPTVNIFNLSHGTPALSISVASQTVISGTATDVGRNIGGVQWSTSNNPAGNWHSCIASDGAFNSTSEGYSCDISSLSNGSVYSVYIRSYDENDMYSPVKVYVTRSIDKKAPTINITNLGLIGNVPDKTPLFYYFTSQTPKIKGKTEGNSTVHFKYGSNDFTSTADASGNYTINIPELPRQYVTLEYYAVDQAGNQSETRKLNLTIGEENFPQTLGEQNGTVTPTPSISTTPEISGKPTSLPDQNPQSYELTIVDQAGNTMPNVSVFINDQKYTANANGKIHIEKSLPPDAKVYVEVLGVKQEGVINGSKVIVETQKEKSTTLWLWTFWWVILILLIISIIMWYRKSRTRTESRLNFVN